jgi:hypothetical protein
MRQSLFLLITFVSVNCFSQQNQIIHCGENLSHPVDIKAKQIADDLKKKGIDTLLIYRDWLSTNGYNGYGKVIWLDKGVTKQCLINLIDKRNGFTTKVIYSHLPNSNHFDFFFKNRLDTITSYPKYDRNYEEGNGSDMSKMHVEISDDAAHFVYLYIDKKPYCFEITGSDLINYPNHPRSQFVDRLTKKYDLPLPNRKIK